MRDTRHERARPVFWMFGMLLAGLALWQCGTQHRSTDTGNLSMTLVARVNGSTYRLRDALFAVSGPEARELSTEGSTDGTDNGETTSDGSGCTGVACDETLTASLLVGNYLILLRDGWRLERDSGAGFEDVAATLLSGNPQSFLIDGGETTRVVYSFEADGRVISFDRGTLEVSITVEERAASPVFDAASCDFDNRAGCEALSCDSVCATNDGGSCLFRCLPVIECVSDSFADGSCLPTEDDPMCAVRTLGQPNTCTQLVEIAGGANAPAPQPAFVARELVRCLCSSPRL